ncbi:MAG: tRNA lysidine(34) synthetase TilS [Muribaculaceae bacterium]|nr:tRNA lysidine(34) synthetase TilS [Muribaculaceae bacterium]
MKENKIKHTLENLIAHTLETSGIHSLLAAVSGGADSVALLCSIARVAPRLGIHVEAANCNFHLRGEESNRDSAFTAHLCERLHIPLHRLDYNVANYLEEHPGLSIEMACRELRYADFFRICREQGLERVAVAHNADDDIETMFMNMLRGSGSRGMRGMDADNGQIIRPLLGTTRKEIEIYLSAINQGFITDSSNLSSEYRRNFIRRDVLPLLESRWPGARKSLSKTVSIMKEESAIVDNYYRLKLQTLSPSPRCLYVYDDSISPGTILRFIEPFGGNPSIAYDILESLGRPFEKRNWALSNSHEATLERDRLVIKAYGETEEEPFIKWEKLKMTSDLMSDIKGNRTHDIIYLPQDSSAYEIRRPRTGDRMAPLGMKGTRLVSDIISDARFDRRQKEAIRVLVRLSDGEIIWVTGLKRSRHELVASDTYNIYKAIYISPYTCINNQAQIDK